MRLWMWTSLLVVVGCDASGNGHAPADGSVDAAETGGVPPAGSGARAAGGAPGSGGVTSAGGGKQSGGTTSAAGGNQSGGVTSAGGVKQSGGTTSAGGRKQSGGSPSTGGGGATDAGGAADGGGAFYTTNFDLTESPLSENGAWHHDGLDWTRVDSGSGIAFGTQALGVSRSGPGQYNDSYAYLSGFPADQQASGVVHLGTIDTSCTHEVEILMRWSDSAHAARGYECNLAFDGSYAQIVRWNGAVGDYTYLDQNGSAPGGVHEGDTLSCSAVDDLITLSVNGVVRASARDSTFPTGNPGIGLWRGSSGCGTKGDYGFTSFTARSAP